MEMSDFAQRLQLELDALGLDRKQLSERTGIPYHRIIPWFRRPKSKPRGSDLLLVARDLNLDQEYLLSGAERKPFNSTLSLIEEVQQLDDAGRQEVLEYTRYLLQKQQNRLEGPAQSQAQKLTDHQD